MVADASGNVYVTGNDNNFNGVDEFRTIKYDSAGNVLWNVAYANGSDSGASGIAVDPSGNVYVTGYYAAPTAHAYLTNYQTIKYNSAGNMMWNVTYSGNGAIDAASIATDPSGNVYVAGYDYNSQNRNEYRIIKYNTWGSVVWNVTYNTSGFSGGIAPSGIAADASGNVYITGLDYNSQGANEFRTIK